MGFEPTISAGWRPQTYALDRAANGTGHLHLVPRLISGVILLLTLFAFMTWTGTTLLLILKWNLRQEE
jgi:hypothetical protein